MLAAIILGLSGETLGGLAARANLPSDLWDAGDVDSFFLRSVPNTVCNPDFVSGFRSLVFSDGSGFMYNAVSADLIRILSLINNRPAWGLPAMMLQLAAAGMDHPGNILNPMKSDMDMALPI